MVAAAAELFAAVGYAGTTMEAVAARSGMSVQSVYYAFHDKGTLLQAALEATPVRPAAALPQDADRALAAAVDAVCLGLADTGALALAATAAAPGDAAVADVVRRHEARRSRAAMELVQQARARRPLARGRTARRAADVVVAVLSPQLHDLLVRQRGWPLRRYAQWCAATIAPALWD